MGFVAKQVLVGTVLAGTVLAGTQGPATACSLWAGHAAAWVGWTCQTKAHTADGICGSCQNPGSWLRSTLLSKLELSSCDTWAPFSTAASLPVSSRDEKQQRGFLCGIFQKWVLGAMMKSQRGMSSFLTQECLGSSADSVWLQLPSNVYPRKQQVVGHVLSTWVPATYIGEM